MLVTPWCSSSEPRTQVKALLYNHLPSNRQAMVSTGNGSVKSFGGPSMKQLYMYHSKGIVVY